MPYRDSWDQFAALAIDWTCCRYQVATLIRCAATDRFCAVLAPGSVTLVSAGFSHGSVTATWIGLGGAP